MLTFGSPTIPVPISAALALHVETMQACCRVHWPGRVIFGWLGAVHGFGIKGAHCLKAQRA